MESNLMNSFCEMTEEETIGTNGGFVLTSFALCCCISAAAGGFTLGLAIRKDLDNCYTNGYNEVYYGGR